MKIRTTADLGALIRDKRNRAGLDQAELAKKAGTSRKWLIEVERGKATAEIGLVLRTLKALGIELKANDQPVTAAPQTGVNIDSILSALKK